MFISWFLSAVLAMAPVTSTGPQSSQTCRQDGKDWQDKYRHLGTYIPTAADALITVHCNIIIWQNDSGTTNWQDTPEHRQRLHDLFHHPEMGLNFQMYERYIAPTDPILPDSQEVKTRKLRFELEGIYFFQDSETSRSLGFNDKRKYLQEHGYEDLLNQLNINITTARGPMEGAWGHAEYPGTGSHITPMITTTDDPNQLGYAVPDIQENSNYPVSVASRNGKDFHRDWSFMEHIAHELGHCLDLRHVYEGKAGYGFEACDTTALDYMDDIFPVSSSWCDKPRTGCDVCLQISDEISAEDSPADGRTNNLMNGKGGRYLSPKQLGKIHRAVALKSISRACSGYSPVPLEITENETWNFSRQLYRPLLIRSGSVLRIKCTLRMPAEGRIIIEPGAKLIVDAGTITRSNPNAGDHWKGIELVDLKQLDFLELLNGGKLEYIRL